MSNEPQPPGHEREIANRFRLISRMADDLAHEIKNPLNSMVINLEVLRSRARKGDATGVLDRADVLESEVRRLNGLIDGILKLLRPERTVTDEVVLDTVLAELGDLVGLQARLSRKELTVAAIGDRAVVKGRRDAIRFALLSLLAAELDELPREAGGIEVAGDLHADSIHIRIHARSPNTPAPVSAARSAALESARLLLLADGGDVDVVESATDTGSSRLVTVRLPRAGAA